MSHPLFEADADDDAEAESEADADRSLSRFAEPRSGGVKSRHDLRNGRWRPWQWHSGH